MGNTYLGCAARAGRTPRQHSLFGVANHSGLSSILSGRADVTARMAGVANGPLTELSAEVAAVFEVPLAFLMSAQNHRRETREWQGRERHYVAMPFEEHYIWGVTAGILRNLYERIYA